MKDSAMVSSVASRNRYAEVFKASLAALATARDTDSSRVQTHMMGNPHDPLTDSTCLG